MRSFVLFVVLLVIVNNCQVFGTTYYSRANGNLNAASTWSTAGCGGAAAATAPTLGADIIICNTYTVTLTANSPKFHSIDIQSGGVLDNGIYKLDLGYTSGTVRSYTNNGIQNATGGGYIYCNTSDYDFDGSGIINCNIQLYLGSPIFLSTCNLTINGNIYTASSASSLLHNYGTLTIVGDISATYAIQFINNTTGVINQTGDIILDRSAIIENQGVFSTSGSVTMNCSNLGSSLYWNNGGSATIVGDVLGYAFGRSLFLQEANSVARFGGRVFPPGNDGNLCASGGGVIGDSEPNTVEYNGTDQIIKTPRNGGDVVGSYVGLLGIYSKLILSNSGTKTMDSTLVINDSLMIKSAAILDVSATPFNLTLKGNYVNTSTSSLTERNAIVTLSGSTPQYITASTVAGGETFNNLKVSNTTNVSLNNDVTVNGTLNFTAGKILLGTNHLFISSPTAITNYCDTNFVVTDNTGYLQINGINTTPLVFPVGPGTSKYNPVTIDNATAADFNVRVCDYVNTDGACSGGTPITTWGIDKTWNIGLASGTANATVELQWNSTTDEMPGFQPSNCAVNHHNGSNWTAYTFGNYTDKGGGYRSKAESGITALSPFGVSSGGTPLPIELLDFTGELNPEGQVVLSWTTATETNNDFFTVESITPSVLWTSPPPAGGGEAFGIASFPIGIVKGAGNSNSTLNYHLLDETPISFGEGPGVRYYRLKQTDYDGHFSYSALISVGLKKISSIAIYPNPAIANVNLNIYSDIEEPILLCIIDKLGRTIIKKEENLKEGQNSFTLDVSSLNPGVYVLQMVKTSGASEHTQLMIGK